MARARQCGAVKSSAFVRSTFGPSPQPSSSSETRQHVLGRLRARIRQIENRTPQFSVPACPFSKDNLAAGSPSGLLVEDGGIFPRNARTPMPSSSFPTLPQDQSRSLEAADRWTLGDSRLDYLVGPQGLATDAVHEIKPHLGPDRDGRQTPNWAACWSAARQFLLALIIRRLASLGVTAQASGAGILWCWPRVMAQEFGQLYAPGISPATITIVEPSRSQDVLWAMEEGLKSRALACVVGMLDDVDLTPARRLALAAQKYAMPALLLTSPRTPPMAATATRWRVAPRPSAQHPIEARLPGNPRLELYLERQRSHSVGNATSGVGISWSEQTGAFRLADEPDLLSSNQSWVSGPTQRVAL